MSIRFRKSISLGTGVRMTVGRRSAAASIGIPGFRVTANSAGRVTRTVGVPGSGVSSVSRLGSSTRTSRAADAAAPANYTIPKPGLFAGRGEKRYFEAVVAYLEGRDADVVDRATQAIASDPTAPSAHLLAAIAMARMGGDHSAIRYHLESVLQSDHSLPDRWQEKYLPAVAISAKITDQLVADVPFDAIGAALVLAELYQLDGRLDEAIGIVQQLSAQAPDDPLIRLSLCDLLVADADYDGALEASSGAVNDGDLGVAALHLRGAALYGQGRPGAAAEAFTAALAKTASRDPELLKVIRYERSLVYAEAGQARRARTDLEKLVAADPTYLDVQERLASLG